MKRQTVIFTIEAQCVGKLADLRRMKILDTAAGWLGTSEDSERECLPGHIGTIYQVNVQVAQGAKKTRARSRA